MVPKEDPDAMPRVLHDYRELNENTIKDHTSLPRQDVVIRSCAKGKFCGKIDFVSSYYQMGIDLQDIHKTDFKTLFVLFEWLVIPQGLYNVSATFQRYLNWLLCKYIGQFYYAYLDDIVFWSDSIEEHIEHARLILNVLQDAGLLTSVKKTILFANEITQKGQ